MAFMGGARLALLRAAREQAESNQNRAERGGAGLRQAILDYGSETRANTYADLAKQQEARAKEKWALEQEQYATELADKKAAQDQAAIGGFAEGLYAEDQKWQPQYGHGYDEVGRQKMVQEHQAKQGAYDEKYGGMTADQDTDDLLGIDGSEPEAPEPKLPSQSATPGMEAANRISPRPQPTAEFEGEPSDMAQGSRDILAAAKIVQERMAKSGRNVDLHKIVEVISKKDAELRKHAFEQVDHAKDDERKQLVLQEKMTEHEIDKLNIEKLRDQLVNDLPKNIGAFYVRNEGLFREAIQPHTGPGEDTRDPKMLALAKVIRTQLGIDRTDPNYENVMTNEFSTRMKLVTDDLAKKKTVKGSEAIASYIMNGMRKKPDEEKAKQYKMADSAAKGMAMRNQTLEKAVNFTQRLEQMTGGTPNASSKIKSFKEELLGYLDMQGVEFTTMEALSEDVLAGFMREVSGLTVNEGEAKRLKKVLPGMDKNPEAVLAAWYEFIDRAYDQHMDLIEIYEDEGQMREGDKWRQKVKWEKGRGKKKSQLIQGQAILRDKDVIVMMPPLGSEEEVAYVDDVDDLKALIVKGYIVAGRK